MSQLPEWASAAVLWRVSELVAAIGFEPVDVGDIKSSIHLEHMCLMWVKMARMQGKGPNFTWAMLQRQ